jgi:hypothetical protein
LRASTASVLVWSLSAGPCSSEVRRD